MLPIEEQGGEGDTLFIDSLTGFLVELKWDVIKEEQQKPGRKQNNVVSM